MMPNLRRLTEVIAALGTLAVLRLTCFWLGGFTSQFVDLLKAVVLHFRSPWMPTSGQGFWQLGVSLSAVCGFLTYFFSVVFVIAYLHVRVYRVARRDWQDCKPARSSLVPLVPGAFLYLAVLLLLPAHLHAEGFFGDLAWLMTGSGWDLDVVGISLGTVLLMMALSAAGLRFSTVTGLSEEPV